MVNSGVAVALEAALDGDVLIFLAAIDPVVPQRYFGAVAVVEENGGTVRVAFSLLFIGLRHGGAPW